MAFQPDEKQSLPSRDDLIKGMVGAIEEEGLY